MGDHEDRIAKIIDLRKPSVLFRTSALESSSYLGGSPPAFAGFRWPERRGRPLGFLACIDLGRFSAIPWLPKSGLLLFFYDVEEQPWGFRPEDRGAWAVLHVPDTMPVSGVAPFPKGLGRECRLPRRDVTFRVASIPPTVGLSPLADLELPDADEERMYDEVEALREAEYGDGPKHQIGGYPEPVQGAEMEEECQLVSNGIHVGSLGEEDDPRVQALRAGAADWRLLLQLDSDEGLKVMWGDCGRIYFWVREQDARRRDFSDAWLVLQCC